MFLKRCLHKIRFTRTAYERQREREKESFTPNSQNTLSQASCFRVSFFRKRRFGELGMDFRRKVFGGKVALVNHR
jgi:hypothetical protein